MEKNGYKKAMAYTAIYNNNNEADEYSKYSNSCLSNLSGDEKSCR